MPTVRQPSIVSTLVATTCKSSTNRVNSLCRLTSSGARKIDDGCTVANTFEAAGCEGQQLTALLGHPKISSQKRLRRRRAQTHDHFRSHQRDLCIQPLAAGRNLNGIWFLMNTPLTARLPFEVFYGVGDIGLLAIDTRLDQSLVEKLPSGTHERSTLQIFFVAGLLTYK